ncbi:MAG: hypothetical protein KDC53_12545, partial [Saprospiraceae bacterium]|nr:hypothetical protein [Saprospiraceae bacterium]
MKNTLRIPVTVMMLMVVNLTVCFAQVDFNVFGYWSYLPDPTKNLYQLIRSTADEQLNLRKSGIEKIQSKADWQQ